MWTNVTPYPMDRRRGGPAVLPGLELEVRAGGPPSLRLGKTVARVHFAAAQALSYMLRPRSNGY